MKTTFALNSRAEITPGRSLPSLDDEVIEVGAAGLWIHESLRFSKLPSLAAAEADPIIGLMSPAGVVSFVPREQICQHNGLVGLCPNIHDAGERVFITLEGFASGFTTTTKNQYVLLGNQRIGISAAGIYNVPSLLTSPVVLSDAAGGFGLIQAAEDDTRVILTLSRLMTLYPSNVEVIDGEVDFASVRCGGSLPVPFIYFVDNNPVDCDILIGDEDDDTDPDYVALVITTTTVTEGAASTGKVALGYALGAVSESASIMIPHKTEFFEV